MIKIFLIIRLQFFLGLCTYAKPIKVGIMAGPFVQIFAQAQKVALAKYNLTLEPVVFTNYIMPNEALNAGNIDLNIYQTQSYLNTAILNRGYKIVTIGNTYIYPMGIYSKKIKQLNSLKNKATIAIPNDLSNEGRALLLLSHQGLIGLKASKTLLPSVQDIILNPKNIKFVTLDAVQIPRVVADVDAAIINNDFVLTAGFKPSEALALEQAAHAQAYINIVAARITNKNNPDYAKVVEVMNSPEVYAKIILFYPGALKP